MMAAALARECNCQSHRDSRGCYPAYCLNPGPEVEPLRPCVEIQAKLSLWVQPMKTLIGPNQYDFLFEVWLNWDGRQDTLRI